MDALADALDAVATAMRGAYDPRWVIGSAAARLHGAATMAANVDLLLGRRDAAAVIGDWRGEVIAGAPGERFRSCPIVHLFGATLPIELKAGLEVRTATG